MEFTSYTYVVFLAAAVLLSRWARGTLRENLLLALSLVFYATWDVRYLAVLVGIGLFTYFAGHFVARNRKRPRVLWLPVGAIVLVLSGFKYTGMLVETIDVFLPGPDRLTAPSIVLPLGISFFTFECISYLLDVYKGAPELLPLRRFLLFPAFWPHMIAGPILRLKEFAPQLDNPKQATGGELLQGVDRVLVGFVKKLVVANSLAPFVDQGFAGAAANSALDNWALAVAFGLQVYFDFSAYSDIAIGSAKMVGFTFPENFNLPYHASSPTEFWTRWHMTLSRWIRDYLFFPLNLRAGKRIWLRYVYLVLVMSLVGLWHGPGLAFILWGTWHGALMVAHRLVEKRVPEGIPARVRTFGGWALTFLSIQAGWILFRSPDVRHAFGMLASMFTLRGFKPAYGVNDYLMVAFALGFYFLLEPKLLAFVTRDPAAVDYRRWTFWCRPLVYGLAIQLVFMFDTSNVAFIYFQF